MNISKKCNFNNPQEDKLKLIKILEKWYDKAKAPVKEFKKVIKEIANRYNGDKWHVYLIAAVLSVRAKDEITKEVLKTLFKEANFSKEKLKCLSEPMLQKIIKPLGFYKTKAANIKAIVEKLEHITPTYEELTSLKGVGRKVAHIVLKHMGYNVVAVDVHVKRITERLIGKEMSTIEVEKFWEGYSVVNQYLVALGQLICKPRKPLCNNCPVKNWCLTRYFSIKVDENNKNTGVSNEGSSSIQRRKR